MGDKPNNFVDTEDQDIDSEYTIEVLTEIEKDFAVECKYDLVVDYIAMDFEGDKQNLEAHYILVDIDHEDNKRLRVSWLLISGSLLS